MATVEPGAIQGQDPVQGRVVQEQVIPARASAAFEVSQGRVIRIVDVEGEQVPDVLVYNRHNLKEQVSIRYSLSMNHRSALTTGHRLVSLEGEPLATIVGDTVGQHWWGGAFCSEALHFFWTGQHGLPGCRENLARALQPYGLEREDIRDGGCLNFFMNMQPGGTEAADGLHKIGRPFSQAGDYVELRADRDILVAISACPDETSAVNGYHCTSIGVVIYEPAGTA